MGEDGGGAAAGGGAGALSPGGTNTTSTIGATRIADERLFVRCLRPMPGRAARPDVTGWTSGGGTGGAPPFEIVPTAYRSDDRATVGRVTLQRMDNVGIVVESLDAAISFFAELGLELEGRAMVEGEWAGRVTGLGDQRVEIAMMRTPDGHSRLELSRFLMPRVVADHRNAPVNALGYLRVMFAVDDIEDTLARLRPYGAELVGELVQYQDRYRLCYVRGPEGILIGLAEQIG
jgi:catechol 2,3-dioxygenase-like lactoylglutathione lyase family enzyme